MQAGQIAFLLLLGLGTNHQKPAATLPRLGFPLAFQVRHVFIQLPPTLPLLDLLLQFHETLEGDTDAELHLLLVQRRHDFVAEERAIHADIDDHPWQDAPHLLYATQNTYSKNRQWPD